MSLDEALRFSVKDSHSLLLNWNQEGAKIVGLQCKVYYDGDDTWFYGRVINFDEATNRHRVHYVEDNESEWINFSEDVVIVACQFVLVTTASGRIPWPAQRYWISPKARELLQTMKSYRQGGQYVEYFNEGSSHEEHGFPTDNLILELSEANLPKKPSLKLAAALTRMEEEKALVSAVIQDLVLTHSLNE